MVFLQPKNAPLRQLIANALQFFQAIDFPGQMIQPGRRFVFRRRLAVGAKNTGPLLPQVLAEQRQIVIIIRIGRLGKHRFIGAA
ncbi:hypothetical protein D3C72_2035600 [compost metagenome]